MLTERDHRLEPNISYTYLKDEEEKEQENHGSLIGGRHNFLNLASQSCLSVFSSVQSQSQFDEQFLMNEEAKVDQIRSALKKKGGKTIYQADLKTTKNVFIAEPLAPDMPRIERKQSTVPMKKRRYSI
jgi:hypothetical protein